MSSDETTACVHSSARSQRRGRRCQRQMCATRTVDAAIASLDNPHRYAASSAAASSTTGPDDYLLTRQTLRASIPIHLRLRRDFDSWRGAQSETARNWIATNAFKASAARCCCCRARAGAGCGGCSDGQAPGSGRGHCWSAAASRIAFRRARIISRNRCRPARRAVRLWWALRPCTSSSAIDARCLLARSRCGCRGVDAAEVERLRAATALARDLINTPANDMIPEALGQAAVDVARRYDARSRQIVGDDLLRERFRRFMRSVALPPSRRGWSTSSGAIPRIPSSRSWGRACASTPADSTSSRARRCC